ncbi:putative aldehyde dehydrogenase family 7 member A1 [Calocera cornea HHB12733]|uniref:Putative aldehyde dehydrogenase family 7 member A1 n=1 Tax=Calocera cornea HHB12733 TaxID=1353952 RepID=A0A165EBB1_9BASI|nr:putative aldehyde dehydrogenase family 7 member A1 [Calocera cornea HHB12733]
MAVNATNAAAGTGSAKRLLSTRVEKVLSTVGLPTEGEVVKGVYMGAGTWGGSGEIIESICPSTGEVLAKVATATAAETTEAIKRARAAFKTFRKVPGPKRGEIIRQVRNAIAEHKSALGALVSLEMGKILTEGEGEIQEYIDICDYAVGLSRSAAGRVLKSERPGHQIFEVANPLGVVGIITAFNFPVAVCGWNFAICLAVGNATVWKPSPTTPLCAIAVTRIVAEVLEKNGIDGAIASLVCGGVEVGETLVSDKGVDLVSFTGSERAGQIVGTKVQQRFGKVLLELGGNNCAIVTPSANLDLALRTLLFSAAGTAGQRCTTTRRLFLHRSIESKFLPAFIKAYENLQNRVGDPLEASTLIGPLHTPAAKDAFYKALEAVKKEGGEVLVGGQPYTHGSDALKKGYYVLPAVVKPVSPQSPLFQVETFAPFLSVAIYDDLDQAIEWHNNVPQGLSSTIFTTDMREMGKWISEEGSDCGIVNVNVATSGAEIGAAFGGNKSTGWGRESGGDAWKQYVRWASCTINFTDDAPLAQGVSFE